MVDLHFLKENSILIFIVDELVCILIRSAKVSSFAILLLLVLMFISS